MIHGTAIGEVGVVCCALGAQHSAIYVVPRSVGMGDLRLGCARHVINNQINATCNRASSLGFALIRTWFLVLVLCKMDHLHQKRSTRASSFNLINKLFTQTYIAHTKSSKNVEKQTFDYGRFKNPLFLWLTQIFKAVKMIMVTAIAFFSHSCATPP